MKGKLLALSAIAVLAGLNQQDAKAELGKFKAGKKEVKVFGRGDFHLGYNQILNKFNQEELKNKKYQEYDLFAGFGWNVYFESYSALNPFIGIQVEGHLPIKGMFNYLVNKYLIDKKGVRQNTIGNVDLRLGNRFYFDKCRNYGLEIYALGGANMQLFFYKDGGVEFEKYKIGYEFGGGLNFLLGNNFMIGFEYKHTMNNLGSINGVAINKISQGQLGARFIWQF